MKTLIAVFAVLFVAALAPCFAMRSIGVVTKQEAKEWGVVMQAKGSGPEQVWLELEFKAEGKLKDFHHVELEVREAGKMVLGYVVLESKREDRRVTVRFLTTRAALNSLSFCVVLGLPGDQGYILPVKELVVVDPRK